MRSNGRVAIFADLEFAIMASTNFHVDDVLEALENAHLTNEDGGISTDEEDDLDRQLETSDSDQRQVFICFQRTDVVMSRPIDSNLHSTQT